MVMSRRLWRNVTPREQKRINEVNSGIMAIPALRLAPGWTRWILAMIRVSIT